MIGRSCARVMAAALTAAILSLSARADEPPPGATLESVLAISRRMSPELAARALETDAAQARVDIAAAFDDPMVRVLSDEIDRTSGSRQNKMIYSVEQEIPLWGKRDLKRDIASAEVERKRADARTTEADLIEKVKVAFARYYQTDQAIRSIEDLHKVVHDMARVARERYTLGRGTQQDVFKAEVESTRVATELARLEAARKAAQGQLNVLLARPANAPLARPEQLRSMPPIGVLDTAALVGRLRSGNPELAANEADITAADRGKQLADKGWFPDVSLNAGYIDRTGFGPNGYLAGIGVKVPLQWGLREAQQREASTMAGAVRARRQSIQLRMEGDISEAVATLVGSYQTGELIRGQLLPQSEALLNSGVEGYRQNRTDLIDVLRAERDLAEIRLQLLGVEFDQQRQLAAIERLIGGDL